MRFEPYNCELIGGNEVSKTWNVINLQVIGWREIGAFASKTRDFLQMFVEFNSGTSWTKRRPEPRITVVLRAKSGVTSNIWDSRMETDHATYDA